MLHGHYIIYIYNQTAGEAIDKCLQRNLVAK